MADSAAFALHRPEFGEPLRRGDAKIARLMAERGQPRRFSAGQMIVRGGEPHDTVYRLRSGWVSRIRTLSDGRSQVIAVFLPGDLFAVKSMYMQVHPDAIVASSQVEVDAVDRQVLHEACVADPDIWTRAMQQVLEDERRLHNYVVLLGAGAARERLAALLIDLRGRLVLSGVLEPSATSFATPFTQEDLGSQAGLSTIHVNRVLKDLREGEVATVRRGQVRIHDLHALWKIALPLLDPFQRSDPAFGAGPARAPRFATA